MDRSAMVMCIVEAREVRMVLLQEVVFTVVIVLQAVLM